MIIYLKFSSSLDKFLNRNSFSLFKLFTFLKSELFSNICLSEEIEDIKMIQVLNYQNQSLID